MFGGKATNLSLLSSVTTMSFGFGVGDFLAVGTLAWKIYRSCKGLTEEFHEVAREAL